MSSDVHEIVPDDITPDVLRARRYSKTTTPENQLNRCPECESVRIHIRGYTESQRYWRCKTCYGKFSRPIKPEVPE